MKLRCSLRPALAAAILVAIAIVSNGSELRGQGQTAANHRIAVFGSSVANGTGDELSKEGYTGRLRDMLAPRGWEVLNESRGGDNTLTLANRFAPDGPPQANVRYLLPVNPSYVLLGLSLGNERIKNGTTTAEKDAVYHQFETNMRAFVTRSRENHITPIITLCYTRNDFTDLEYTYTRRMNLLINTWDVPSVNFLGAVDDGTGKWAKGFWWDSLHPNASGHDELTTTFVPTLFDALEQGKPLPQKSTGEAYARITGGTAPIAFSPADKMHPFAVSVEVRAESDGTVAAVSGVALSANTSTRQIALPAGRSGPRPPMNLEETTLNPDVPFTATVGVQHGVWTYTSSAGATVASTVKADAAWHHLLVSHFTARGETLFFVDGQLAGHTLERLQPARFVVGGPGGGSHAPAPKQVDFKDLLIYRSALNADEAAALAKGTLLQASLEVYAPLQDATFKPGARLENRAQSTTFATVGDGKIARVNK